MNTIQWTTQAEYWLWEATDKLNNKIDTNTDEILDKLAGVMHALHLTETTRSRIRRLLMETLHRRTESGELAIRLFTDGLTSEGAAQSCGFFLIEKKGGSDVTECRQPAAIELYLFQ